MNSQLESIYLLSIIFANITLTCSEATQKVFKSGKKNPPILIYFLAIVRPLKFYINFKINFSVSITKPIGVMVRTELKGIH